jgi:hypothetical protein
MNKIQEFRRLHWLLRIQHFLNIEKRLILLGRMVELNSDNSSLEVSKNDLTRLLQAELKITELSYSYSFDEELDDDAVKQYLASMLGLTSEAADRWGVINHVS